MKMPSQNTALYMTRTRYCAVAVFAFTVLFSVTAVESAMLLLAGALIFERGRAGELPALFREAGRQPLFRLWLFYLAAGLLAAAFALNKTAAFSYLPSDAIKYLCFAVLLASLKEDLLPPMSEFYTAGAIFTAALGTGHVAWFFSSYGTFYQRAAAFSNPVRYGEIMVIAFAFTLSALLLPPSKNRPGRGKYYLAASVLIFITVILTRTRGAYLGLLLVPAVMFAFDKALRGRIAVWAGVFLVLTALAAFFNPYLRSRISDPYNAAEDSASESLRKRSMTVGNKDAVGVNIRLELWKTGLKMFKDHPVLGLGPANIKTAFNIYHPGPLGIQDSWGSVHNLYLQQLAERGIVGLAALAALFGGMFALALKNFRAGRNAYTLWALAALPAYFVMNLTEISFQHIHTSFAVLLALAASTNSIKGTEA